MDKVLGYVNSITDLALAWGTKLITEAEAKKQAQEKEQFGTMQHMLSFRFPCD